MVLDKTSGIQCRAEAFSDRDSGNGVSFAYAISAKGNLEG